MSRPIVVTVCVFGSSESWGPLASTHIHGTHMPGGGAVHSGEIFARARRAVLLSDTGTMPLRSRLNAMLRTSLHPRGRTLFRSRPSRASPRPPDAADLLVTAG